MRPTLCAHAGTRRQAGRARPDLSVYCSALYGGLVSLLLPFVLRIISLQDGEIAAPPSNPSLHFSPPLFLSLPSPPPHTRLAHTFFFPRSPIFILLVRPPPFSPQLCSLLPPFFSSSFSPSLSSSLSCLVCETLLPYPLFYSSAFTSLTPCSHQLIIFFSSFFWYHFLPDSFYAALCI